MTQVNINITTRQPTFKYTIYLLLEVRKRVNNDVCHRRLNPDTCKVIRKLRLNQQGKRVGVKNCTRPRCCNQELLVKPTIKNNQYLHKQSKFFILSTINAQSIKAKENIIHEMLVSHRIKVCLITGTWLRSDINDDTWVWASSLSTKKFRMSTLNRQQGSRLALIHNKEFKIKLKEWGSRGSFKIGKWQINLDKKTIKMIGIYHPPYSGCNLTINNMFTDDLTEWLVESLLNDKNIIIMGDFNIHITKRGENEDVTIFMNTIEVLGIQQHINF